MPPYEDRTKGDYGADGGVATEEESQARTAESIKRQQTGEATPQEATPESLVGPTGGGPGREPPKHTGESIGRRGEDQAKHNKEAGREDTEGEDSNRPAGESTPRDVTGVNPQKGPN